MIDLLCREVGFGEIVRHIVVGGNHASCDAIHDVATSLGRVFTLQFRDIVFRQGLHVVQVLAFPNGFQAFVSLGGSKKFFLAFVHGTVEKSLDVHVVKPLETATVIELGHHILYVVEKVLEVHDAPELLVGLDQDISLLVLDVLAQSVDTTHGLEQRVVFYLVVDIENGCARSVKTCEQLVDHDEELHLGRTFHKETLRPRLILVGVLHPGFGKRLLRPVVFVLGFGGLVVVSGVVGYVAVHGVVARHDGAPSFQVTGREKLIIAVGLKDGSCYKHGVTPVVLQQSVVQVIENAVAYALDALFGGIDAFHGSPAFFHHQFLLGGKLTPCGQRGKFHVNLFLARQLLLHIAVFILQVEYHLVFHCLLVQVFVDIWTESAF